MASFFIALLCVSILGLVSLIAVKRWELSGGRVVLASIRPRAGAMFGHGLLFIERRVPALVRELLHRGYAHSRVFIRRSVAWIVLHTEHGLERTLRTLRGATQERGTGEASAFLREVAEHKKSLSKRSSKKKNAIYEE